MTGQMARRPFRQREGDERGKLARIRRRIAKVEPGGEMRVVPDNLHALGGSAKTIPERPNNLVRR